MTLVRVMLAMAAISSVSLPANAQPAASPSQTSETKNTPSASIDGTVMSAMGGAPLQGSSVVLHKLDIPHGSALRATTDMNGRFRFDKLLPGRYRIWAEKDGYVRTEYGSRTPGGTGSDFELRENQNFGKVDLRLVQQSTISGRVLSSEQQPISGVNVQAVRELFRSGRREFATAASGVTNKGGEYALFGLAPGRYYVYASPTNSRTKSVSAHTGDSGEQARLPAYYPASEELATSIPIDAAPGMQLSRIDITLPTGETHIVRGHVTDALTREARPGMTVYLMPDGSSEFAPLAVRVLTIQDPRGFFQFDYVRPGSYVLIGEFFDENTRYAVREQVSVGRSDVEFDLFMTEAKPLAGDIKVQSSGAEAKLSGVTVDLTSSDPTAVRTLTGKVDENGRFRIENVIAGTFQVGVSGLPTGLYAKALRIGDRELTDFSINVTGDSRVPLEIELSTDGSRLSGTALDAKRQPAGEAIVVLVPSGDRESVKRLRRQTKADERGSFELSGVPPGRYLAFAVSPADTEEIYAPTFLRKAEVSGVPLDLKANGVTSVELPIVTPD